jgi:hypothetical protein
MDSTHETPRVEATPELKKLLQGLTNGAVDIVDGGVVVARIQRIEPRRVDRNGVPPWEVALAIGGAVSVSDWSTVPDDLAKQFDHYRYGHAKEE